MGLYATTSSILNINNTTYEGSEELLPFYINGSTQANISNFSSDFLVDICYEVHDSNLILSNSDLSNCSSKQVNADNSFVDLIDSLISNEKMYLSADNEGRIIEKYNTSLNFYDEGNQAIVPDKIELISIDLTDPDNNIQIDFIPLETTGLVKLIYQKSIYNLGFGDMEVFHNYDYIVSKDRYVQTSGQINLETIQNNEFDISLGLEFPENIYEMKINNGIVDYTFNSYPVTPKTCSSTINNKEIYSCYDIDLPLNYNNSFVDASIYFTVPEAWMTINSIPSQNINLYHYNGSTYELLDTTLENSETNLYSAKTTSFSEFAISGEPASCLIDSDCDENFSCVDNVCVCSLDCNTGYDLNIDTCACEEIVAEEVCELVCDDGYTLNGDTCTCEEIVAEEVCELVCDDGYTLNEDTCVCEDANVSVDDDQNLTSKDVNDSDLQEKDLNQGGERGSKLLCDISCPEGTLLDTKNCVCVKSSGFDANILIIILIIVIIAAVIIFSLNKKQKSNKIRKKPKIKSKKTKVKKPKK